MLNESANSETLWTLFERAAKRHAHKTALYLPKRQVTFSALHREAMQYAESFRQKQPGSIGILKNDKAEILGAFFGALAAGRPGSVLDTTLGAEQLNQHIESLRCAYFCSDGTSFLTIPSEARPAQADEFYWGFSSGTTGAPKAFARTHRSWLKSFEACETIFPFHADDCVAIPGGLQNSLFLYGAVHALCRGCAVSLVSSFNANSACRHFSKTGVTVLYTVPAMLAAFKTARFSGFVPRLIFCGGAKLSQDTREDVESLLPQCNLIEFYGASELSFVTYVSTNYPAPPGSVGRAFPGVDLKIVKNGGSTAQYNEEGLVAVSSPLVFSRYLNDVATEIALSEGWHTAGDLGYRDAKGFLFLTGRLSRVINVAGRKINPERIEQWLERLPDVSAAAVVATNDPLRGKRLAIVLELQKRVFSHHDFIYQARQKFGMHFPARDIFAIESMPRTTSGKVAIAEVIALVNCKSIVLKSLGDGSTS